jgi:pyridinium-3,5-biscarboxylic acid mononucleotide synthase
MSPAQIRIILDDVKAGNLGIDAAEAQLKALTEPAVAELGYATLDLHRKDRCGFPEVILAEGKTPEWVEGAIRRMVSAGQDCFATRLSAEHSEWLERHFPNAQQDKLARTFWLPTPGERPVGVGSVIVVTAGTGDLPVAQEAVVTARVMGANVSLVADVGVAGIHRVLRHRETLAAADVVVVVAGMDGALPSVVGGLVACPVIACPTSIGYGAAFGGVAALLTMLNSCSAGVCVVNIDAGFKAGYVAALIVRGLEKKKKELHV